jgi:hypothetical protein
MKRLPFLANSDFHKPKHIYSWKTLLYCEKNAESIKECIRRNEHVSITLYRDNNQFIAHGENNFSANDSRVISLEPQIPLTVARST